MGHFYFIRHGQSAWNVENKICGATDIALTEKGHEQAIETGKKFIEQGLSADMILYSPLVRAAETARHISEMTGIPMRVEERLREQNFGKYEGTARDGAEFKEEKTYILVAHNGIARVIQSYFYEMTNAEYAEFGVGNCSIIRYDI